MNYKEASSVAREMKRFFEAFERLEEMLLAAADAEHAVKQSQKTLTTLKSEIAEGQSKMEDLVARHAGRKSALESNLQELADAGRVARTHNEDACKAMDAEFAEAKLNYKNEYEAEVEAFDEVLDEKNKRLAKVLADLHDAEEAYEAMKQKFTR